MPRVNRVKSARKEWNCGRCGILIEKGQPYTWAKTRYGPKMVRCPDHHFRPSELVSSDKLQRIFGAQEQAQDAIGAFRLHVALVNADEDGDNIEAVYQGLQDLADEFDGAAGEAEEVGNDYQESADNLDEYFPGSEQVDEITEKANSCEEYSSLLLDAGSEVRELSEQLSSGLASVDEVVSVVDSAETAAEDLQVS